MTKPVTIASLIAVATLPACTAAIKDANTVSKFTEPTAAGVYTDTRDNERFGSDIELDGDGYAYRTGNRPSGGFIGEAGIIPGTAVAAAPTSGIVVYSGTFELARITGINLSGNTLYGFSSYDGGALTLTGDFDTNTLSGSSGLLTVNGTIASGTLDGTVTYNGLTGPLDGVIGSDRAVGVFHGDSSSQIFAGGFMLDAE